MNIIRTAAMALPLTLLIAAPSIAEDTVKLETPEEEYSYAVGVVIGNQILEQVVQADDLEAEFLAKAINDVLTGGETALSMEQAQTAIQAGQQARQAEAAAAAAEAAKEKLAANAAWLEENAKVDGITTTESGLQYKVLAEGEGASPTLSDQVSVHYTGKLLDGTVFDSSVQRGQPATFPVGGVIPGWIEALQLMKKGDKFEVWIPSELAYAERGAGGDIGPNEILNFEMELLEIISN